MVLIDTRNTVQYKQYRCSESCGLQQINSSACNQACNQNAPYPEIFEKYKRCVWNFKNVQERYIWLQELFHAVLVIFLLSDELSLGSLYPWWLFWHLTRLFCLGQAEWASRNLGLISLDKPILRSISLEQSGSTRSRKVNRMIACVIDRVAYVVNRAL